jgi:hypothetical protein
MPSFILYSSIKRTVAYRNMPNIATGTKHEICLGVK